MFQSWGKIPPDHVIQNVAKFLLAPIEVLMWMKHLQEIKEKRKKGVEKKAAKRKKRRKKEEQEMCLKCKSDELPGNAANMEWIACDGCAGRYHAVCDNLQAVHTKTWHCPSCMK